MRPWSLKRLWRSLFPVRVVLVYKDRKDGIPSPFNDMGDLEQFDALLPELVEAYTTCAPMFKWLAMEIARKEKEYHAPRPAESEAYDIWRRKMDGLNDQLAALNVAVRVPLIANRRIIHLKEIAEKAKATEAERKAIEDFFEE